MCWFTYIHTWKFKGNRERYSGFCVWGWVFFFSFEEIFSDKNHNEKTTRRYFMTRRVAHRSNLNTNNLYNYNNDSIIYTMMDSTLQTKNNWRMRRRPLCHRNAMSMKKSIYDVWNFERTPIANFHSQVISLSNKHWSLHFSFAETTMQIHTHTPIKLGAYNNRGIRFLE